MQCCWVTIEAQNHQWGNCPNSESPLEFLFKLLVSWFGVSHKSLWEYSWCAIKRSYGLPLIKCRENERNAKSPVHSATVIIFAGKIHQRMLKSLGRSLRRNSNFFWDICMVSKHLFRDIYQLQRENSNFIVEKPSRYHLNQVFKIKKTYSFHPSPPPSSVEEHIIISVVFLPQMPNLSLIIKHHTNPNCEMFYKISHQYSWKVSK